jgi:hypothetical protein
MIKKCFVLNYLLFRPLYGSNWRKQKINISVLSLSFMFIQIFAFTLSFLVLYDKELLFNLLNSGYPLSVMGFLIVIITSPLILYYSKRPVTFGTMKRYATKIGFNKSLAIFILCFNCALVALILVIVLYVAHSFYALK